MKDLHEDIDIYQVRAHIREHIISLTGLQDITGFEITAIIRMIGHMYENIGDRMAQESGLSLPRIGILFRLWGEEQRGNTRGLTPSQLSDNQHVSRNTISAFLRGLEGQGYIERDLNPDDRRMFHIRLTPAGRALVMTMGPKHIIQANADITGLTRAEQEQLLDLLSKLFVSLQTRCQQMRGKSETPSPKQSVNESA